MIENKEIERRIWKIKYSFLRYRKTIKNSYSKVGCYYSLRHSFFEVKVKVSNEIKPLISVKSLLISYSYLVGIHQVFIGI